ncbi:MAG: DUF2520 domain-containing protein [Gemmatimonadota bacterium]|jgi:predicted short-subunit dehydrogenase-like oxidoreductase (DUF2520 family)|nr:DUF2520 domain-containing protein [Gemmatimonadota bacterium]
MTEQPDHGQLMNVFSRIWMIGVGRLGLALGSRIAESDEVGTITFVGRSSGAPEYPVFRRAKVAYSHGFPTGEPSVDLQAGFPASSAAPSPVVRSTETLTEPPTGLPTLVIIAVPDGAITAVAADLAAYLSARQAPTVPVLHTSGALGPEALLPLSEQGHPVGSLHPLIAVSDAVESAGSFSRAWFGVGGEGEAVRAAERLVLLVDGRVLRVDSAKRPVYHAAAVFASNYIVALLALAEDLMTEAGAEREAAREALTELARGAVDSAALMSPAGALTGPISRGDDVTVNLHLSGLSPEMSPLYSGLGRITLGLARIRGLNPQAADRIARALEAEVL